MRRFLTVALLLVALLVAGCTIPQPAAPSAPATEAPSGESQAISVAGSTTVQPLAERLAETYAAMNPAVEITVQGGGSGVGVKSAGQGTVDVGMASREVKDSEKAEYPNVKIYPIARDGIAVVVHPKVPVEGLTKEQVRGIFSGQITNWQDVGGSDELILVVSREEGSGTRAAFEEMVMGGELIAGTAILQPSNGAVRTTVATTPMSIGYLSFGYLDAGVKALAVDGVSPTPENAASGAYPVVRPLNMLINGEPNAVVQAWLDYILGADGQAIVVDEGYLSVR